MPKMIAMLMSIGLPGFFTGAWLLVRTLRRCAQRRRALVAWIRMDAARRESSACR